MDWSRRTFLKFAGLLAGAAFLPANPPDEWLGHVQQLGRAIKLVNVYARPALDAERVSRYPGESVFPIIAEVLGDDPQAYNRRWYRVADGFVYSGQVQPVRWAPQPAAEIAKAGRLGEVSVPFTDARTGPYVNWNKLYRLYYSTTVWLTSRREVDGRVWYQLFDERLQRDGWVPAEHIRVIPATELTPLSPAAADKRIEVNLAQQTFECFEDGRRVLGTLCSTGPYLRTENGQRIYGTPAGEHVINRKRLTRHMAGDDFAAEDFFDLPGVPWVSYFHWWGVSIHGTYWHNDYGKPHSHGCVNLTAATAKWVYRWTMPKPILSDRQVEGQGTQVVVY